MCLNTQSICNDLAILKVRTSATFDPNIYSARLKYAHICACEREPLSYNIIIRNDIYTRKM